MVDGNFVRTCVPVTGAVGGVLCARHYLGGAIRPGRTASPEINGQPWSLPSTGEPEGHTPEHRGKAAPASKLTYLGNRSINNGALQSEGFVGDWVSKAVLVEGLMISDASQVEGLQDWASRGAVAGTIGRLGLCAGARCRVPHAVTACTQPQTRSVLPGGCY